MYIPGFGDVSTPQALSATLAGTPTPLRMPYEGVSQTPLSRMRTQDARAGVLGSLANPLQGQGVPGLLRSREGSEGAQVPDLPPAPTTRGVTGGSPYATVLPPLTPEMQSALDARRRAASRAYEIAAIEADDARIQAEAQRQFTEQQIDEATRTARRQGMSDLAVRGVARSPMFANPFRRELVRQQQAQLGQAESTLANTLDQLGRSLQAAELQREREFADIGLAAMQARSNLGRIMGTA